MGTSAEPLDSSMREGATDPSLRTCHHLCFTRCSVLTGDTVVVFTLLICVVLHNKCPQSNLA